MRRTVTAALLCASSGMIAAVACTRGASAPAPVRVPVRVAVPARAADRITSERAGRLGIDDRIVRIALAGRAVAPDRKSVV